MLNLSARKGRVHGVIAAIEKFPNFQKVENRNRVVIRECETYSFEAGFTLKLSVTDEAVVTQATSMPNNKSASLDSLLINRSLIDSERDQITNFINTLETKYSLNRVSTGEENNCKVYVFRAK